MQVLTGQPASALAAVQQADAEAFVQSKPKMPIKGQRNILVSNPGRSPCCITGASTRSVAMPLVARPAAQLLVQD
jgi:hypothetical protein